MENTLDNYHQSSVYPNDVKLLFHCFFKLLYLVDPPRVKFPPKTTCVLTLTCCRRRHFLEPVGDDADVHTLDPDVAQGLLIKTVQNASDVVLDIIRVV